MAMIRTANAVVVLPQTTATKWRKVRTAATELSLSPENLIDRASRIFGKPFNPRDFLMTHATIVASVDTYAPSDLDSWPVLDNGFRVNRRYPDFRITQDSQKYINQNKDAWSRPVLAKSYQTFIGGHNFVEHVQREELSKGRIIDAVLRDILGETLYVDILIATSRKHKDLVEGILSGEIENLSMGCTIDGSQCSRCGHWAADEHEMCDHIKHQKGNVFFDEMGRKHITAELCGHHTLSPTGGVQFIEASWVGVPAFPGAVRRSTVELPESESTSEGRRVAGKDFLAGWEEEESGMPAFEGEESEPAPEKKPEAEKPQSMFEGVEKDIEDHLTEKVKKKILKDIDGEQPSSEPATVDNDSIIKQARFASAISTLARFSSNDAELLDRVATLDSENGLDIPVPFYRAAVRLGSTEQYDSIQQYYKACRAVLGRELTFSEVRTMVRLGKILSLRNQVRV